MSFLEHLQGRKQRPDRDTLRAVDFGSAAFIKPGEKVTGLVGSSYYMAPEVLAVRSFSSCQQNALHWTKQLALLG